MSCSKEFIDVVCSALAELGNVRARRMMGDYIIYVNDKMVITACDEICYVKKLPAIADLMADADCGSPYEGAKEHYILDMDLREHALNVVRAILGV